MFDLKSYSDKCKLNFGNISYYDTLRSSFFIYSFILFFLYLSLALTLMFAGEAGYRDYYIIVPLVIGTALVWYLFVVFYKHYELKSPLKKKIFQYRFSCALKSIAHKLKDLEYKKGAFTALLKIDNKKFPVKISYSQDIWINVRKISAHGPGNLESFKKPHPRTWFLKIEGNTQLFNSEKLQITFSARRDDHDNHQKRGVKVWDYQKKDFLKRPKKEIAVFISHLHSAISGSILKGEIELDKGKVTLKFFDNLLETNRWLRPIVKYRPYEGAKSLLTQGLKEEEISFYNLEKVLDLFFK